MAVWSTVNLSALPEDKRLDAEYFQPIYIQAEREMSGLPHKLLQAIVSDIRYGLYLPPDYTEDGLVFVRGLNLCDNGIDGELLRVPVKPGDVSEHYRLRSGDILISRSGNVGDVGIVDDDLSGATFGSYILRIATKDYDPIALYLFLKSRHGRLQISRLQTGGVQGNINIPNLRRLIVPLIPPNLTEKLNQQYEKHCSARRRSQSEYAEAEALLVSALGLDRLDLTLRLFCERTYKDASAAGRLDAEYHNPRAQNLIAALSRDRRTIADVAKLALRRFRPASSVEFQYIEIGDVGSSGTAESSPVMGEEAPSRAQWVVRPGDVITTTVRPIRRLSAIVAEDQAGFICSSGFAVLKPTDIEPELLLVYLRLPLVCELLKSCWIFPYACKTLASSAG